MTVNQPLLKAAQVQVGSYNAGAWLLDMNSDGFFTSGIDRSSSLGWSGAVSLVGDWNGDGRAKIGVYSGDGYWYLDYDGNGVWDGGVLDKLVALGWAGATPVIGDWNGDGKTKIGVYSNTFWFLDYDGNYLYQYPGPDKQVGWGWTGVTPVVGDWNGNGRTKIGVYSDGFWFLDYNGDYLWDGGVLDKQFGLGWTGATPIVGNWNGDGRTKVGVYSGGYWYVDYDGNYAWNYPAVDKVWAVGWSGTTPVIGDWSGDGKAKPGAFINGYWYLDYNGNGVYDDAVQDRLYLFGGSGDTPVVGRWTLTGGGPQVTTPSLPNGQTGVPYSQTLSASGGTPPYSWSLAAGSLPPGLTLSSGGTISGTPTTNGTYNFTARVTDGASQTGTKPLGITVSDQLTVFRNCLSNTSQTECILPVGTYSISQTLTVDRPNVTISGGSADRSLTKLVRAATFVDPILRVAGDSSPVSGVAIQNLTICGSSVLSPNDPSGCPRPSVPTACGNITAGTEPGQPCVDFEVKHAAINGAQPADPFSFQGTYAVTVSNVAFEDATGHAVSLYANAASLKKVNDISITGSAVNRSEITGILAGADFGNYQPKDCDNGNFKDDGGVYSPRNLRIKNNTFIGNNTGAMGINQARWVSLRDNTFTNNYRKPQVGNEQGGTVFFDQCTDTIEIVNNRMVGPGFEYLETQGMELWGRNITVKDNPEIRNYGNDGIQLNSVKHAEVKNNVVENNNRSYFGPFNYRIGGIVAWTSSPWDPPYCAPVPRDIEDIDIIGNTSTGQSYGIHLGNRGRFSRNILKDVNVTGDNNLSGNNLWNGVEHPLIRQDALVGLEGYGGGLTPDLIEAANSLPTALPIDTLSVSRRKCAAPWSPDPDSFIFSASDAAGVDNIDWIQGVFSLAGSDETGAGGPDSGAQGCHFIYYRSANTIYLDGPNGGSQWVGSSVIGGNGTSLSNGYCTIHAGASIKLNEPNPAIPVATTPATVLTLKLSIAFPQPLPSGQHRHMYSLVRNFQDVWSGGNSEVPIWNYWGWWASK